MLHSIFALELCLPHEASVRQRLHQSIVTQPEIVGHHAKWCLYQEVTRTLLEMLPSAERGCWDYFNDDARARHDYNMWSQGMITEEGARTSPSGASDAYRDAPRFMTFTMAFLLEQNTACDRGVFELCNIPEANLWRRDSYERILRGLGVLNFTTVKSDVIYLIPGADDWALTPEDLQHDKFEYLRIITG